MPDDSFELYDLRVEVEATDRPFVCKHQVGEAFEVRGEDLIFAKGGKFSLYALAALLPLLPARQRITSPHDWISTDALIACPDPNCGALFRIRRMGKRTFHHGECTVVPLGTPKDTSCDAPSTSDTH